MALRTWIAAWVLMAALVSCSDEVIERGGGVYPSAIRFTTVLTKGEAIKDAGGVAHAGGFNVWAYQKDATTPFNKMNGLLVTSADSVTWNYGEAIDWPGGEVSFYAYAPAGIATEVTDDKSIPDLTYTVPTDPTQQKDLLIANQKESNGVVQLKFNHALSKISFSALKVSDTDNRETYVKKIQLTHIYNKGTTAMNEVAWKVDETSEATYVVELGKGLADSILTTYSQNISDQENLLFLMPQTINRGSTEDAIQMTVTLLINGGETTYTAPVFSPDKWEPGRSYNYQISVDHNSIKVIEVGIGDDLQLNDWAAQVILQSVMMPYSLSAWNEEALTEVHNRFYKGLANLDTLKASPTTQGYSWFKGYKWFGLYATHDVKGDITLTMKNESHFAVGDYIIFDFKKSVEDWEKNASGDPYKVKIVFGDNWKLSAAFQYSDKIPKELLKTNFDGSTGATLPLTFKGTNSQDTTINVSDSITHPGAIILQRIKKE